MKTYWVIPVMLISTMSIAIGQMPPRSDSLKQLLLAKRQDTSRVMILCQLSSNYRFNNPDSSMFFAQQAMQLAGTLNFPKGKARALYIYGEARRFRGEFAQALEAQFEALQISKNSHYLEGEELSLGSIGFVYNDLDEYRQALYYLFQAKKINDTGSDKYVGSRWLSGIGNVYEKMNKLDSALFFLQQAQAYASLFPANYSGSAITTRLGVVQSRLGHLDVALRYFRHAIKSSYATNDIVNLSRTQYRIAELYYSVNRPDSSLDYCRLAFANGNIVFGKSTILDASNLLVKLYKEKNNLDSAFRYQEVAMAIKDSLYGREKFQQLQLLTLTQQQRQQQLRDKQVQLQRIGFVTALAVFLLIALVLWRNIRFQKRTNKTLNLKNAEIETQRNTLEKTLAELKGAQAQLIQSEKMASLGELTAGIAHEIQNPLNFVNNFSEVSTELVEELKGERSKVNGERDEELENDMLNDLSENLVKINHHGKRADAIVKGMLQHSRASSGKKEPTNINALADEYLRLSYHGLRAKDKDFNAEINTDFDASIGKVEVVGQDIGRVLLNLYNNAFYAVNEKKRQLNGTFEPAVSVSTKRLGDKVEIVVKDNGNGIPQKAIDKIFQPFFTTKPTGQGTGLGLSLSYDIIKAHGGELKVKTKEGEGAEFIIHLYTT
jgi:two-component system NtrC family sensor kinase